MLDNYKPEGQKAAGISRTEIHCVASIGIFTPICPARSGFSENLGQIGYQCVGEACPVAPPTPPLFDICEDGRWVMGLGQFQLLLSSP